MFGGKMKELRKPVSLRLVGRKGTPKCEWGPHIISIPVASKPLIRVRPSPFRDSRELREMPIRELTSRNALQSQPSAALRSNFIAAGLDGGGPGGEDEGEAWWREKEGWGEGAQRFSAERRQLLPEAGEEEEQTRQDSRLSVEEGAGSPGA